MKNATDDIRFTTAKLQKSITYDLAAENSFYYRQKGACHFFYTGQTSVFFECMHKSAGSYLFFLKNGKESDKRTSDGNVLFDAVNAGLWNAAQLIAQHSRKTCNFDYEYEDDFLYNYFLLNFFFLKGDDTDAKCAQILKDYEQVLAGDLDVRFLLCKSIYEKSEVDFLESFDQFLLERAEKIEKMIQREVMGEEEWSWARYFSNEGLALLKLGESLGFELSTNYSQIPEALRHSTTLQFNSELWKEGLI